MPRQMPESNKVEGKDIVNLSFELASILAACVWPFTRTGFGTHAFTGYPWSFFLMLFYAQARRCASMRWYIPAWLCMVVFRRFTARRDQHSRSQGYPWPFIRLGYRMALFLEIAACFAAAAFVASVDRALADFLLAAMVAMLAVMWIESAVVEARRRAKRDAEAQARWMNEL